MKRLNQDQHTRAWKFAAQKHNNQLLPGIDLPYIVHIGTVTMEVMAALPHEPDMDTTLAICCALLHDTIEDTNTTPEELTTEFGPEITAGVLGLTKDKTLPNKRAQMQDSLARLKQLPKEVQMVKLADRISNLGTPPSHWTKEKCGRYREEAGLIYDELKGASEFLAGRLLGKIGEYEGYCG